MASSSERIAVRIGGRLPLIIHQNVLVIVDEGRAVASDYFAAGKIAGERLGAYPNGFGCMVIIPASARPPPEDVRRAIKDTLSKVSGDLRCLCWMVEGSGFRAATLRAALAGLSLFVAASFPTSVKDELADGLRWILKRLDPGANASTFASTVVSVEQARESLATV